MLVQVVLQEKKNNNKKEVLSSFLKHSLHQPLQINIAAAYCHCQAILSLEKARDDYQLSI